MVYRYPVQINHPFGDGPSYNIWHFRGQVADDDPQAAVAAIQAFYELAKSGLQVGAQVVGPGEVIADIETSSPTYQAVNGFSINSTGSGEALSPALQGVVGWRTTSATRSGRGRTFVGPLSDTTNDANGSLSAGFLGALNAAGQSIVDYNDGLNVNAIGVWSPTQGVIRDIVGRRVRDQFAVLRSRRG